MLAQVRAQRVRVAQRNATRYALPLARVIVIENSGRCGQIEEAVIERPQARHHAGGALLARAIFVSFL